jgi:PAS domain S-box-containing protein
MVVGLAVCALAVDRMLSSVFEPDYLVPFLTVVLLSAWFGGRPAGLLSAALTAAALLVPPGTGSVARFSTYLLSAVIIAYLAGELRQMSVRWEGTLKSIGDGVVVVDQSGCVKFLNPAAEAMTGWTSGEARKKRLDDVVKLADEKSGENVSPATVRLLHEGRIFRTPRPRMLTSRDGQEVWVEDSSAPVRN